jgi:large subunit ribosomal protein L7/L12
MSSVVEDLTKKICDLTLIQASELAESLKKALNLPDVSVAAPVQAAAPASSPEESKPTKLSLILSESGEKKIAAVKALKSIFKKMGQELGLQEIKSKLDELPYKIASGLDKSDADQYIAELKEAGCKYELKEE